MAISYLTYNRQCYRLNQDGLALLRRGGEALEVSDPAVARRILRRGRSISESEAVVLTYAAVAVAEPERRGSGKREGVVPRPARRQRSEGDPTKARNSLIAAVVMVGPAIILALVVDSGMGFFVEVASLFVVMPAFLFGLAFLVVVAGGVAALVMRLLRRLDRGLG